MSLDIPRGESDYPMDPHNPEYITIAVAIEKATRKAAFFSFHVPANANPTQGIFVIFSKTIRKSNQKECLSDEVPVTCFHMQLDQEGPSRLQFDSCNAESESCVARVEDGLVEEGEETHKMNLLEKFLSSDHLLIIYVTRDGHPMRTMVALFPFKKAYERVS